MGLFKIIQNTFTVLLLIVCVLIGSAYYQWRQVYSGEIEHTREYSKVSIYRDELAIPHVVSEDFNSVMYGLGYAHCQDRLWNMDIYRRVPSGRMSELFGNATLETDILLKELGISEAAENMRKQIPKQLEITLQAYADGINDCADNMLIFPLEYQITQSKFTKWEVQDSLYFYKLLVFQLTNDWQFELVREKLLKIYGRTLAAQMFGNRKLFDETTIMNDEELKLMNLYSYFDKSSEEKIVEGTDTIGNGKINVDTLDLIMKSGIVDFLSMDKGSNGWVIHGNHTTTGKPIVANDPHLHNAAPAIWSQAVLHFKTKDGKQQTVSGGSMPGQGLIYSGMTNYFAWSVTTLYTDSSDLYQETISEDGNSYLVDGEWRQLKKKVHPIIIKGSETYNLTIKSTHRGNILLRDQMNVSFAWTGSIASDRTLASMLEFYEITDFETLKNNLHLMDCPPQAVTFGTQDGHIGFFGNGVHQVHSKPYQGAFIQDGTKSSNDWIRYINKTEQPKLYDPPKGFVVTGNNKFASDNVVNQMSMSIATSARGRRITKFIEEYIRNGTKISPEDVMNMQADVLDSFAEKINPTFTQLYHRHKGRVLNAQNITSCDAFMKLIENWDFRAEKESIGATAYYAVDLFLSKKLIPQVSEDLLVRQKISTHAFFDQFKLRSIEDWFAGSNLNEIWCSNSLSTLPNEHCIFNFVQSVLDAYVYLQGELGNDLSKWQYGRLHNHHYIHTPFSKTPLKSLFELSFPSKGSKYTVHVSAKDFANDSWNGIWGANYKMISSLDQKNTNSYYIIDTGISGNVLSPHYADQQQLYTQGLYVKQNRDKSTYSKYEKLTLSPRSQKKTRLSSDL